MNELSLYRLIHGLLAVARLANELRQAVVAIQGGPGDLTPDRLYQVDGLDLNALDALSALAEALPPLERSVLVTRAKRDRESAARVRARVDVPRETLKEDEANGSTPTK